MLEGALEILETTDQVYIVRAVDVDSSATADASATVQMGACPAVLLSAFDYGVNQSIYFKVQVKDASGVEQFDSPRKFALAASTVGTGGTQAQAMQKVFGGTLDSDKVGAYADASGEASGFIVGSFAGSGASLAISAFHTTNYELGAGRAVLRDVDVNGSATGGMVSSITTSGVSIYPSSLTYETFSINPGAGHNLGTKANGDTSGNSVEVANAGGIYSYITVNQNGQAEENFKVSLLENKGWIEDEIQTGETNLKSDIIKGELYFSSTAATPTGS